jgi:hypothetical protein
MGVSRKTALKADRTVSAKYQRQEQQRIAWFE